MTPAESLPDADIPLLPAVLAQCWLDIQCRALPPLRNALVLWRSDSGTHSEVIARWPKPLVDGQVLTDGLQSRLDARQAQFEVFPAVGNQPPTTQNIYFPFILNNRLLGAFGAELPAPPPATTRALLEWGALWLEFGLQNNAAPASTFGQSANEMIKLMLAGLEAPRFEQAVVIFVNQLAAMLGFQRVGLALNRGKRLKLVALSHRAEFDSHSVQVRSIEAAMLEAQDQRTVVVLPNPSPTTIEPIARAHAALLKNGAIAVASIPVYIGSRAFGVVTLERTQGLPLDPDTLQKCYLAVTLTAPILDLKHTLDQGWLRLASQRLRQRLTQILGPQRLKQKLFAAGITVLLATGMFGTAEYRVVADAALEGRIQRVVAAPMDGFLLNAMVRPGDEVQTGQVLGQLDDRDLRLEQTKWQNALSQHQKEIREAMAQHDAAQVSIFSAQIEQAEAQLALLQEKLNRAVIKAPFAAVVLDGDLSQSHGAPVTRGDVLFRLAPLEDYRLVLEVDERDIAAVTTGLAGELRLAGLPAETIAMHVKTLTPVASAHDGRNVFRVEAQLDDGTRWNRLLRPGMKGVGKIAAGRRSLAWLWTHGLIDWCRVQAWGWLP